MLESEFSKEKIYQYLQKISNDKDYDMCFFDNGRVNYNFFMKNMLSRFFGHSLLKTEKLRNRRKPVKNIAKSRRCIMFSSKLWNKINLSALDRRSLDITYLFTLNVSEDG